MRDRRKFIGGSDVAAICGMSPYNTPLAVWGEKTGKIIPEDISDRGAVKWGNYLEATIARFWAKHSGVKLSPRREASRRLYDQEIPYMQGEVDFWVEDGGFLEVKTASLRVADQWGEDGGDIIPMHYYCQVQHYLALSKATHCYVAVLIGGQDFRSYKIEPDHQFIEATRGICVDFWEKYVETGDMPMGMISGLDNPVLAKLFPESTETRLLADDELLGHVESINALKDSIKRMEIEVKDHAAIIKAEMKEHGILFDEQGRIRSTWNTSWPKKVDWRALCRANGITQAQIEEHMTQKPQRTFLPKKLKEQDD